MYVIPWFRHLTFIFRYIVVSWVLPALGSRRLVPSQTTFMSGNNSSSQFINLVTGTSELSIGDGLESCTTNTRTSVLWDRSGRKIQLIDTPGFDHTAKSDLDVLKEIANCLSIM